MWPACVPQVVKVASVKNDDNGFLIEWNWNVGNPDNVQGPIFLAPGGDRDANPSSVRSADRLSSISTGTNAGTSFAAPQVSGVYAAAKSVFPNDGVASITAKLIGWSIRLPRALPGETIPRSYYRIMVPNP